ncbi:MAG: hypothetical protein J0I07_07435, partial [Myxococcales bacterium]|nr:hypothetical protein [Myxococcales bacterium]
MKRALPISVLCMIAAAAACADSNDDPRPPIDDTDGSVTPPSEGGLGPETSVEAGTDTGTEAGVRSRCNEEGWCLVPLPDPQALGVKNFRVVGLAMDAPGKVWA